MRIKARLNRLEIKIRKPRCECETARPLYTVFWDGEPEPTETPCPICGSLKPRIIVSYHDRGMCGAL